MADTSLAIATEYLKCFLAFRGKGIWWPEAVRLTLAKEALDSQDIIYVMTHGEVTESKQEIAHGTTMWMIGHTCDEVRIRVKFWSDIDQTELKILEVERI